MRTQGKGMAVQLAYLTAEVLGNELVRDRHRHIVVELVVVGLLDACRHCRVSLHMLTRPVLELCAYLVNFGAALGGGRLVGYRFG